MSQPNFRIVPDPRCTASLAAFFNQFERASPGFVPILSMEDHAAIARELAPEVGSRAWWDALERAHDGKRAAIDFRDRMRRERMDDEIGRVLA